MELGSILSLDSLVPSSLENDPMNQKGLFDSSSSLLKHVRSSSEQDDYWSKSLKSAKNDSFNGEQMLSFSSASCNNNNNNNNNNIRNNGSLPPYYNPSVASSSAYFYGNGGMNVNMHGAKSPFSPSQWLELEHQAMIYKYIEAKAPIPSHLLFPYRRSIHQSAFSFYPSGSLRSNAFGWGAFNLGFSGNGDPEPGRCRRTDGKKWRCSRNAFADQKYCERHMNRGRHRSRKHVEGQSGQASKPISSVVNSSTAASGSLQSKNMDQFNRIQMGKEDANSNLQDSQNLSLLKTASPKNLNPFEADFGLASSNFLPNSSRTFHSNSTTQPLHRFIDEWPKITPTDFSSSSNSPNKETFPLSPLRLSREFGTINEDDDHINVNWAPTSWKPSTVGGPLGEVLNNTNCSTSLYILTDELASPTDVLQKTTFGSVSSSTGSSPRADVNKMSDNNNGMCGAFLGLK